MTLENQDIKVIFATLQLIMDHHINSVNWWQRLFRQSKAEKQHVKKIYNMIVAMQPKALVMNNKNKVYDSLLDLFDEARYIATTHFFDNVLRENFQDSLIFLLFYREKRRQQFTDYIEKFNDSKTYLAVLKEPKAYQEYVEHLRKQLTVYGRKQENLTDEEVRLAARGAVINGKWLEHFGLKSTIEHGLSFVKKELQGLINQRVFIGFFNQASMQDYIEKIDAIKQQKELDNVGYVQYARYLIEAILNAAGTLEGQARHLEHKSLVFGCYWIDELFLEAKSRFDVPV
ncbi:MAG: hypothetical protein AAGG80_00435 [Pseudomonadota bacterium]